MASDEVYLYISEVRVAVRTEPGHKGAMLGVSAHVHRGGRDLWRHVVRMRVPVELDVTNGPTVCGSVAQMLLEAALFLKAAGPAEAQKQD